MTAPAGRARTDVVYNDAVGKFTITTIFWDIVGRFLWALRSGQFDDRGGAASRIVSDDDDSSCQSIGSRGASRWDCE